MVMVIYDKNQFLFNIVFIVILIASLVLNLTYYQNFKSIETSIFKVNENLSKVEENQNFNFIQAPHYELLKNNYMLTTKGFYVTSANDTGIFNGPSMQPAIFDGNTLIETKYDGKSVLSAGQIIRYKRIEDDKFVVHRVRADYGASIYVQGDTLKDGEIIEKGRITHIVVGVLYT
jgi:NhaP-type Na+/H+ and K+/H+ antiporter